MKKIQLYCLIFSFLCLCACGGSKENKTDEAITDQEDNIVASDKAQENAIAAIALNDKVMEKYMATMKLLKTKGADISKDANGLNALFKLKQLEDVLQEGGFKDFNEFVAVHTKIVYGLMASEMQSQNVEQKMKDAQSEGIKQIEESLKDPNISAEQKKILEQTLEQMKGTGDLGSQMQSALESYKNMVTEDDIAVVKKYTDDLKKVYESDKQ